MRLAGPRRPPAERKLVVASVRVPGASGRLEITALKGMAVAATFARPTPIGELSPMAPRPSRAGIEMSFTFAKPKRPAPPEADVPFRLLVMGDFSGAGQPAIPGAGLRLRSVDPGNVDASLAAMDVRLELDSGDGRTISMAFRQLDDFHPNHLFETLDVFSSLKLLRQELRNPHQSAAALARIRDKVLRTDEAADATGSAGPAVEAPAGSARAGTGPSTAAAPAGATPPEGEGDMMSRLFGRPSTSRATPSSPAAPSVSASAPAARPAASVGAGTEAVIDSLIRPWMSSHAVARPDPDLQQVLASVDQGCAELMRSILHHPQYCSLEAAWRGVSWLCGRLGDAGDVELVLLDISKEALAALTNDGADTDENPLSSLLAGAGRPESGSAPWALLVGNYEFDQGADDVRTLQGLASLAERLGAPFVAGVDWSDFAPAATGPSEPGAADWARLRAQPASSYVGLVAPRFLLRLPYGKKSDPVDGFDFEELADPSATTACLWGNGALACAALLGISFAREGWGFTPGDELELGGLPVYAYRRQGESLQAPCAEAWVSSPEAERASQAGLMVLQFIRGRDAARMLRIQSIHEPPAALAGPWD